MGYADRKSSHSYLGFYRGEGTSQAYAPIAFPIVADLKVTTALIKACNRLSEVSILHSSSLYSRCLLYTG